MNEEKIVIGVLAAVNVVALFVVGSDKRKSMDRSSPERTPEGILFFIAAVFGAVGVYAAGQIHRLIRHQHPSVVMRFQYSHNSQSLGQDSKPHNTTSRTATERGLAVRSGGEGKVGVEHVRACLDKATCCGLKIRAPGVSSLFAFMPDSFASRCPNHQPFSHFCLLQHRSTPPSGRTPLVPRSDSTPAGHFASLFYAHG